MSQRQPMSPPAFDEVWFWLRWPYWALIASVALVSERSRLGPTTLAILFVVAAGLNILLFLLLRIGWASRGVAPLFGALDAGLMAALLLLSGNWPTPLYPLAILPPVMIGLRWGAVSGLIAGLGLALAGLGALVLQSAEQLASLSLSDQAIALVSLPVMGALAGVMGDKRAGEKLRQLTAEVEELRFARERSDAIYAMASTLGATLNYQRVLETLFDVSAIEFRAVGLDPRQMVGMALLFEEGSGDRLEEPLLHVAAGHNLAAEDWKLRCKAKEGVLARVLASSQPEVICDIAADPELKEFRSLTSAQSAIVVPLRAGFDSYGVILFASPQQGAYDLNRCHFLVAFSNQVTIALQNARLFQNLRDEQNRIINQQEEIRRQIARELHDGPTQTIAALAMRLNYVRVLLNHNLQKAGEELAELEDLARRTAKELRTMLFTLRPVVLETQGLAAALREYGERLKETDGLIVTVNDSRFRDLLTDESAHVVFSILEEAINNARKHAQCRNVLVTLQCDSETFLAEVQDDGIGFDLELVEQSYDQRGSLGLLNMKERAKLIDGTLIIRTKPGEGTRVTLIAPLHRPAGSAATISRAND